VAKHGALSLTLNEAASIACLERHYFSNKFTELVGESFKEWRCRYRIAWAVQAIAGGRSSITDVMQRAGYSSRRAFERAVKRLTGATPGCIRRESEGADRRVLSES
jgi:AraC-like DNA-binding protein